MLAVSLAGFQSFGTGSADVSNLTRQHSTAWKQVGNSTIPTLSCPSVLSLDAFHAARHIRSKYFGHNYGSFLFIPMILQYAS